MCCFRNVHALHFILERSATDADGHNEVWIEDPTSCPIRGRGSKHLILFEEVDVLTDIERDVAGQKQPMPTIIRAANRKTVREIHHEIRAAQVQDVTKDLMSVQSLPTLLFQPYLWLLTWRGRTHPRLWKKNVGTVGITAVGCKASHSVALFSSRLLSPSSWAKIFPTVLF